MKKIYLPLVLLLLLVSYVNSDKLSLNAEKLPSDNYEIPVCQVDMPEVCLERMGYTVSFNPKTNIPNWVAWELNADKLIERESRSDKFVPDPDIEERKAITTDEYKGSGWDRGHMCPAGDNRWHWRAMDESFYMTNICPQNHNLNRGDWKELEEACRRWAATESVYIVCGPILYKTPKYGYIGYKHQIRIPDAFFKVVLPEIMPGVFTGALMAFTMSLDDFIISYFTSGSSAQTLSVTIYNMTKRPITPEINALSTLLFGTVLILLLIVNVRQIRGEKSSKGGAAS